MANTVFFLLPAVSVIIATIGGVFLVLEFHNIEPMQDLSIILSTIAIGLAIGIFVFQIGQNRDTTNLIRKVNKQIKDNNDLFKKRKDNMEKILLSDLVLIHGFIIESNDLIREIEGKKEPLPKDVLPKWKELKKYTSRLNFALYNSDFFEHNVILELQFIKELIECPHLDSMHSYVTNVERSINRLMREFLESQRHAEIHSLDVEISEIQKQKDRTYSINVESRRKYRDLLKEFDKV